jgi:4-methyl-5(b-hydroxyethyl)-thiazole monophosphate biosynthesis
MPKAVVLLADGFEEVEAMSIIDVLRRAQIETTVAALHSGPVMSAHSVKVLPDALIDAVNADDFDVVALPGGQPGANNLNADPRVRKLLMQFALKGKLTAAICAAPIVLADAGLLAGKKVTSFPSYQERLKGTDYLVQPVVVDGAIITSRGPGTAILFALAIVERLVNRETALKIKEAMLVT